MKLLSVLLFTAAALAVPPARASELVRTVAAIKPSVVGVGTWLPTRSPAIAFVGTGFAVGDGLTVVTNAHCVPAVLDSANRETFGIVLAKGDGVEFRPVLSTEIDHEHDLALLRLGGTPLPALTLGDSATAAEGQQLAFTGFPLGMVLGLHPATHRALLAAITPIVMPALGARQLDARAIAHLHKPVPSIFQLDGTAYPGNSGSPLYDPDSGVVLGVINMVLVKGLKESALTHPSGIAYAVPARYIRDLMQRKSP